MPKWQGIFNQIFPKKFYHINQASSQLESEVEEDVSIASEQGAVALREMGFPDYDD